MRCCVNAINNLTLGHVKPDLHPPFFNFVLQYPNISPKHLHNYNSYPWQICNEAALKDKCFEPPCMNCAKTIYSPIFIQ